MISREQRMNPVVMTIINPHKEILQLEYYKLQCPGLKFYALTSVLMGGQNLTRLPFHRSSLQDVLKVLYL